MNDIYFKCKCGKSLAVDLAGAGTTIHCIDCATLIEVPEPDMEFTCQNCSEIHFAISDIDGDNVLCTVCGKQIMVFRISEETYAPVSQTSGFRRFLHNSVIIILLAVALGVAGIIMTDMTSHRVFVDEKMFCEDKISDPAVGYGVASALPTETEGLAETALFAELSRFGHEKSPSTAERNDVFEFVRQVENADCGTLSDKTILPTIISDRIYFDGEHPAKRFSDRFRQIRALNRETLSDRNNPEFVGQLRKFREEFMDYTQNHSGPYLDSQYWFGTARSLLWLSSSREHNSFAAADKLFRQNLDAIASARTDNPALNSRIIFNSILLHVQEWRYRAPAEACVRWLAEASEMAHVSDDPYIQEKWAFHGGTHLLQLIFESSARASMPSDELAKFRAEQEEKLFSYLYDESIPLKFRTSTVWWKAVHLATEENASEAVRVLDEWLQEYGEQIVLPNFYELRLLLAFHHEADLRKAREIFIRFAGIVADKGIPSDNRSWRNMTEKYFAYLLIPEYEARRIYQRAMKRL